MKRRLTACAACVSVIAAALFSAIAPIGRAKDSGDLRSQRAGPIDGDSLVVHEWGTFTSLQDEDGNAIGGINVDDEPLPKFVHRIANHLLLRPDVKTSLFSKGTPRAHPDVTMRLETPVVYFYPKRGEQLPLTLDVEVVFRGGWLSEYYPEADVEAPGVKGHASFGPISDDTVGRLQWNGLRVGTADPGPETSSPVWLAPRAVQSAAVTSAGGESEQFLFYRGVGHVDSPLRVSRDESSQSLILTANFPKVETAQPSKVSIPSLWLVDIRPDKSSAFREIEGFQASVDGLPHTVGTTAATFEDAQFDQENIKELRAEIRSALIADGLFDDEADALLNTWESSYFQTAGLRLFYLLPRAWTDQVLPLSISAEADVVRTMVGRIEIVTPEQRQLLARIAAGSAPALQCFIDRSQSQSAVGPDKTVDDSAYQQLGRFRNALILDELKRRPTSALQAFVDGNRLHSYQVAD